ncbi:uncharacterized protein [Drosophila bipectinata]|uniref:uncharacterized protein n=1 Tax=Drosophila bipectinata TaxID=42026 RepID=UPI001C893DEC|nr:uncharacterized protein LOC108132308 [Drosophila bipectinata]
MKRIKLLILILELTSILLGVMAKPRAQNPLENLGMTAMNLAGNIAEAIQSGAAINRDINFDNPLMSVHSKTAVGYGDAMRPPSADSSEEEDRRKRRSLLRAKRAPCFWKMTMTTAASSDDDVEARRKRARKRAANNASRSRVSPKTSSKKKFYRERRQAETDQMPAGTMAGSQAPGLGDRIKGMWLSFVDNVTEVVQQMREKISSAANSATGSG